MYVYDKTGLVCSGSFQSLSPFFGGGLLQVLVVHMGSSSLWTRSHIHLTVDQICLLHCWWGVLTTGPPGKSLRLVFKNTGVGCHYLLQGIFLTQGSNLSLLSWQVGSLLLSHLGSPSYLDKSQLWRTTYNTVIVLTFLLWKISNTNPPGSSVVHVILPARILEWVAISSSRESFRPKDQSYVSCIGRWINAEPPREPADIAACFLF